MDNGGYNIRTHAGENLVDTPRLLSDFGTCLRVPHVWIMTLYPGGAYVNHQSCGYGFRRNLLSDLGMPLSWGDPADDVGALLFVPPNGCLHQHPTVIGFPSGSHSRTLLEG